MNTGATDVAKRLTSAAVTGGTMVRLLAELKRNPYCFVKTRLTVSCRALNPANSNPPHPFTEVMLAISSDSINDTS